MRTYEVNVIFRSEEEAFKKGSEFVRSELGRHGGQIKQEDDLGSRTLAYPIKKQDQGHHVIFYTDLAPAKVLEADKQFKLQPEILKFLFVVQEA